ncbi:MAG: helix-turn-helix transcriptional regulator [Polyangiales bacterium]
MTRDAARPRGTLYLWPDAAAFLGRDLRAEAHAKYAATLTVAVEGSIRVRVAGSPPIETTAVLVGPNVEHEKDAHGAVVAVVLIDPGSQGYLRLEPLFERGTTHVLPNAEDAARLRRTVRRWLEGTLDADRALARLVGELAKPVPLSRARDRRIDAALALLRAQLPSVPSVGEVADAVGLSEGRFIHLFRDEMGLPMRRYASWMRVRDAALRIARGESLTDAALEAGFADSSHLCRTFRAMFGVPPSLLLATGRFVDVQVRERPATGRLEPLGQVQRSAQPIRSTARPEAPMRQQGRSSATSGRSGTWSPWNATTPTPHARSGSSPRPRSS